MSDPFVAEIRMFPFNVTPAGWAACEGQLLPISHNTMLFSLLGTTYGGDGKSTFALPNLNGRAPMHPGDATFATSLRDLGEEAGSATVALRTSEVPVHTHTLRASSQPGEDPSAVGESLARAVGAPLYESNTADVEALADEALEPAGGGVPHENMQPYLTVQFCIALQGIFPIES